MYSDLLIIKGWFRHIRFVLSLFFSFKCIFTNDVSSIMLHAPLYPLLQQGGLSVDYVHYVAIL